MRPPAVFGQYKIVPPEGDTINGIFLPGGTAIGHNAIAMMRSETVFGEDTEVFRPERFTEASESKRLEMERTVDLLFGIGRWMCAGKTLALVELNKIYFEVRYDARNPQLL
jgi:cytochrome P450